MTLLCLRVVEMLRERSRAFSRSINYNMKSIVLQCRTTKVKKKDALYCAITYVAWSLSVRYGWMRGSPRQRGPILARSA